MSIAEKLVTIAENEKRVYEAGKQAEYNEFWDNHIKGTTGNGYPLYSGAYAFAGGGWNDNTFYPPAMVLKPGKYGTVTGLFARSKITNLKQRLEECGVTIDLTGADGANELFFYMSKNTHAPAVDFSVASTTSINNVYTGCESLVTIEEIVLKEDGTQQFQNGFNSCNNLQNVTIKGKIKLNSLNFKSCTLLTVESMKSIIFALFDNSGTIYEGKFTLIFASTSWDILEADSTSPTGTTWREYVDSLGWLT